MRRDAPEFYYQLFKTNNITPRDAMVLTNSLQKLQKLCDQILPNEPTKQKEGLAAAVLI